jgi:predicted DNA-binding transcriptional regulator YafY
MPTNRNALFRYQVIDKCLRNRGRKWTWEDILEKVNEELSDDNPKSKGIGKTTFYEDIKNIEYGIYHLEIERIKDGKTTYLRYADSNASINNQPLTESEAEQIKSAILVISRFKGVPQFDWIHEVIPILESKMGLLNSEREIISFENNIDYSGAKHIPALFNAILNKRVLKLSYQDFKSPIAYEVEIHPQYLKQSNSRWFIMSFTDKWGDKPSIHALDRIKEIKEVKTKYRMVKDLDWDDYFSDMIGVTKFDKGPVDVKLLIKDEEQAAYIDTKPLHQSQKKIKKVKDGYETSINVILNYELEKLIFSFGERIKVVGPSTLKDKIKTRVKNLYRLYLST